MVTYRPQGSDYWFTDEDEDPGWGGPTFASVAAMNETARANQLAAANRAYEGSTAAAAARDPRYTFSPGTSFEGMREGGYEQYPGAAAYTPNPVASNPQSIVTQPATPPAPKEGPFASWAKNALESDDPAIQAAFKAAIDRLLSHGGGRGGSQNAFGLNASQMSNPYTDLTWLDKAGVKSAAGSLAQADLNEHGRSGPKGFAALALLGMSGWSPESGKSGTRPFDLTDNNINLYLTTKGINPAGWRGSVVADAAGANTGANAGANTGFGGHFRASGFQEREDEAFASGFSGIYGNNLDVGGSADRWAWMPREEGDTSGNFGDYPSEWGNIYQAFGPSVGNPFTGRAWGAMQKPSIDRYTLGVGLGDINPAITGFKDWISNIDPMGIGNLGQQLTRASSLLGRDPSSFDPMNAADQRAGAFRNYLANPMTQIELAKNYGSSQLPGWLRNPFEESFNQQANRWLTQTGGAQNFLPQFTQGF